MPATEIPDDLSPEQLVELEDRMKAARQELHRQEAAEKDRRQRLRKARSALQRAEADLAGVLDELEIKRATVADLRERLAALDDLPDTAATRTARASLTEALELAVERGATVISGDTCPTSRPAHRLLFELAPHGVNWRTPVENLEAQRDALTAERDRLQERLDELEDEDPGDVAA